MADHKAAAEQFETLVGVMKRLRAPGGCPWDRKQDYMSLRRYILEEAYELIEAIESGVAEDMREECGDLLLQVVFVSEIAEERGDFELTGVIENLTAKLVRRHPHVFGDVNVKNSDEVLKNWEQIKVGERKERNKKHSLLTGIPRGLPALLRAHRMQERAAKVGFDWPKDTEIPVMDKVKEEFTELAEALSCGRAPENTQEELGDILFALVNLTRRLGFDAENLLHMACAKFSSRFEHIETSVAKSGRPWSDFPLDELEELWKEAKETEKE